MIESLTIALSLTVAGGPPYGGPVAPPPIPPHPVVGMRTETHHGHLPGGFILPPGPGDGWGFPNGSPDGYGWYDPGIMLPIREDRTTAYYFRRYMAVPAASMFLPNYYNPYITRGQRYLPYVGMGGFHAAGGPPTGSARTPVTPYSDLTEVAPLRPVPEFSGEIQAEPVGTGTIGEAISD